MKKKKKKKKRRALKNSSAASSFCHEYWLMSLGFSLESCLDLCPGLCLPQRNTLAAESCILKKNCTMMFSMLVIHRNFLHFSEYTNT
jgi:hypothetical protein